MKPEFRVTVLVENTVTRAGLLAEHGLSLWIEYEGRHILFDTGQTEILIQNAYTLGIDLKQTDAVVLSHGHYDHTGGLAAVLDRVPHATIYCHSLALAPKYHRQDDHVRTVGMPADVRERLLQWGPERVIYTDVVTELSPGVTVTGAIPRCYDSEGVKSDFYLDAVCHQPDPLHDDQALLLDTQRGTVVILGCAHAGIINTLEVAQRLINRPVYAVIGGMHLRNANPRRLAQIRARLQNMGVQLIAPGHCTGARATAYIHDTLSDQCMSCSTGMCIQGGSL